MLVKTFVEHVASDPPLVFEGILQLIQNGRSRESAYIEKREMRCGSCESPLLCNDSNSLPRKCFRPVSICTECNAFMHEDCWNTFQDTCAVRHMATHIGQYLATGIRIQEDAKIRSEGGSAEQTIDSAIHDMVLEIKRFRLSSAACQPKRRPGRLCYSA